MKKNLVEVLNIGLNAYSDACTALIRAIRIAVIDNTNIKDADEYVSCIVSLYNWVFRGKEEEGKEPIVGIITSFKGKEVYALTKSGKEIDLNDLDGDTLFEIVNTLISQYSNKKTQQKEDEDIVL